MPYKLYAPGTRKGNRYWVARGTVAGKRFEISTGKGDKTPADEFAADFVAKLAKSRPPRPGEAVTFARAAELYKAYRSPPKSDQQRIHRLVAKLGPKLITEINPAALVEAADALYPKAKASSKNRNVVTIASAILHYAAENGLCEYRRFKRFKEPRPKTRAITREDAEALIDAATGTVKGLLLFLFRQGTRITDTIRVDWQHVDLKAKTFQIHISKTDEWLTLPLAEEVFFWLANAPNKSGAVFPYRNRWHAYKAIGPAAKAIGIKFTPHMARHSLGTWMSGDGASLRTIMGALGHRDAKSSIRYQAGDVEVIRSAIDSAARGKAGGKRTKRKAKQ